MAVLKDITELLEKWPVWKAMSGTPARVEALEKKVEKLETDLAALLAKRPPDSCPACGERGMRLTKNWGRMGSFPNEYHYEDWTCEKCAHYEQRTVPHTPELANKSRGR